MQQGYGPRVTEEPSIPRAIPAHARKSPHWTPYRESDNLAARFAQGLTSPGSWLSSVPISGNGMHNVYIRVLFCHLTENLKSL